MHGQHTKHIEQGFLIDLRNIGRSLAAKPSGGKAICAACDQKTKGNSNSRFLFSMPLHESGGATSD